MPAFLCLPLPNVVVDEDQVYRRQKKGKVRVGMDSRFDACNCSRLKALSTISTSDRSFIVVANAMAGSRSWIEGVFHRLSNKRHEKFIEYPLTPIQEQRLQKLRERIRIPFDESHPDHQEALRELWHIAFPDVALKGLVSQQWKEMGWQGPNPSTDFRELLSGLAVSYLWKTCCSMAEHTRHRFVGYYLSKTELEQLGNTLLPSPASIYLYVDSNVGFIIRFVGFLFVESKFLNVQRIRVSSSIISCSIVLLQRNRVISPD
ncbi:ELMO domain-containing protein A-like isoform X1 [Hibiscus syriacus]|uniref:ELMO domain-containing protein A-like isoform X1 n=1 Tax=Hibiscus syriacus TaxID=106335 RepID=A0A6A2XJW7_HIBSY|nr:ELMO domain-containing protein A-like isoform X1 [Hibiscus syriacus]